MEIKKIKLLSSGFKGAEVTYLKPEVKNQKTFINEVTEKRKYPIHYDMEKPFKDLRFHLLEVAGIIRGDMDKRDIDYTISECEVDMVKIEGTSFVISGSIKCIGDKSMKLETPKIDDNDDYTHYDTIMKIFEVIIEESIEYLNGTKKLSEEEVVVRYITSGKDKSEEAKRYDSMSMEEKRDYHTRILEQMFGSFVMHNEDAVLVEDAPVEEKAGEPLMIEVGSEEEGVVKLTMEDLEFPEITIDEQEEIVIPIKK